MDWHIEDVNDEPTLFVGGSPVVKIVTKSNTRYVQMMVYGPMDYDRAVALAKGLLDLIVFL